MGRGNISRDLGWSDRLLPEGGHPEEEAGVREECGRAFWLVSTELHKSMRV